MSENMLVCDLEQKLFEMFPLSDAEPWDRVGLSIGDPSQVITGVACALDVTTQTIREAEQRGANVLVTHHPVFIDPPFPIISEKGGGRNPASSVYEAISSQVSLIAMHTNLDRSLKAARIMPEKFGLKFVDQFEDRSYGGRLGAVSVPPDGERVTVEDLACRAEVAWGRKPRIWGESKRPIGRVLCATGSLSSLYRDVIAGDIDTVICGESSYHNLLDMTLAGRSVIVLGHDVSELPLVACLHTAVIECGVDPSQVIRVNEPIRWKTL